MRLQVIVMMLLLAGRVELFYLLEALYSCFVPTTPYVLLTTFTVMTSTARGRL